MAQVACCPQCHHDLLVPDAADHQSWAKCPQCRAFFQIQQVAVRDVPALLIIESSEAVVEPDPSAGDATSSETPNEAGSRLLETIVAARGAETVSEQPPVNAGSESTADRIDEWFRAVKTVPDVPPGFAKGPLAEADEDGPVHSEVKPLELREAKSPAPWDDAHHMERLLADIEAPPADRPAVADEPPTIQENPGEHAETLAATSVADVPVFSKSPPGTPRRKRSLLRTFMVSTVAGVAGLALGYYALLWLRGPTGDFLDLAQYLPDMMLPAELQGQPHSMPAARVMADQPIRQGTIPAPNSTSDATDSAEVQASFTTTEEPTPGKSNVVGDRYGSETHAEQPVEEPAALDIQAAAPLAGDATSVGAQRPAKAPSFTADELADALQAARDAQPSLVTGNLEDGREVQRAKGAGYSALADLAQKATLVDVSTATESLAALLQAAEELYRLTLSDPHTRREVAVITPKWIASPYRKHGGVFFAASVSNPQQAGDTIECQAALESGQSLTLLVPPGLADRLDDSLRLVGVIGWIVDDPAAQLSGYAGDAKQAVWVGKLIPVE